MDYADPPHNLQILLIEDNPSDARLLQEMLSEIKGGAFALEWSSNLSEGLERLTANDIEIVLLDLLLPDSQGLDTFIQVQKHSPQIPIIILSGLDDEVLAVEAVREGAQDYLPKGQMDSHLLERAIYYAIERKQAKVALTKAYAEVGKLVEERTAELKQEIIERKRIEEALRESEKRYRHLYNQTPVLLHSTDAEGYLIDVNNYWLDVLGYKQEEALGQKSTDFLTETSQQYAEKVVFPNFLKHGFCQDVPYQMVKKSGEVIDVLLSATSEKDEQGNIIKSLAVTVDITKRKQAEEQLRKLWRAIEQSPNTVTITNTRGDIEYVNPKFTEITGYGLEEILGQNSRLLSSGEHTPAFYKKLWDTIVAGEVWQDEFHNRKKNGELYWELASISPVRDAQGTTTHFVKVAEDVTERKQAEKVLLQASRLETAATLAGGIAHKVNNLMTAVIGYAELLKTELRSNTDALEILTTITKSAGQTGELAQQMLAFARGGKYHPRILDLNDITQKMLQLQQRSLPTRIHIKLNLASDLWNIEGDPTQMSHVVLNLFTNAIEAIEGEGHINITTKNIVIDEPQTTLYPDFEPGLYVCLSVQDTGYGMDTETLARIFEPFFTTKFQGRGMGLAAVYGIVDNHDGHITAASHPDEGTTIKVCLPAIQIKFEHPPEFELDEQALPSLGTEKKQTILVTEDDETLLKAMQHMLTALGHQPLIARNGQEAVEIAQTFAAEIHLTLLDLGMPVMSGAEAYPLLMKARPDMKVILYSGYELDETAQALLDVGASAFIQKPFQLNVLKTEIRKALND
ncbi:PAS domain S-box protein [Chloroflexota bacterium]